MFYNLINACKRRLTLEIQDCFSRHPVYEKIVPFIQNRSAFDERPQFGIVIKGSSANKVQLAADDFKGTIDSHVMLTYVGAPTYPLEWIREDLATVQENAGRMPTMPGIYYMEILTAPTNPNEAGAFVIDPLIEVPHEPLIMFQSGIEREAQLAGIPVPKTLRLWLNQRILLAPGTDYDLLADGAIRFKARFQPNDTVTAGYYYALPSIGPIEWYWNTAEFKTLPGVVLAFGKRGKPGDKVAIRVYPDRVPTASAFGGRFDLSFDLDVIVAGDANAMEEIADLVIMYLWSEKRSALSFDGIELVDVSMGGESEEAYDETADLMYYTASLSVQLQVEWETHVPLPLTISQVSAVGAAAGLAGANAQLLQQAAGDLLFQTVPIKVGLNNDFERIT